MLEQLDADKSGGGAVVSLKLALSQEARASLETVRAAQESARQRARRQTRQARIWVGLLLGASALGAVALGPRVAQWRRSRAPAARPAIAAAPAFVTPAAPVVREPEPAPVPVAAVPAAAPAKAPAATNDITIPTEGCDTSTRSGLWRRSAEACAQAFAADPNNASLALAVAQAEHAHARMDSAAQWAKRALALDPNAAEAYIIIAHADVENGREAEARTAYRRYLEIAPRGWHRSEARAALRRAGSSS